MYSSKENVKRTVEFRSPDRLACDFSDIYRTGMNPSPDTRYAKGIDEWGAVWENIGVCSLGEVKDFPLKDWKDFDKLKIPDIAIPERWSHLEDIKIKAGDKFIIADGISIYERVHFIRGLENTWSDIYESRDELCKLLDLLVDMNLYAIERYKQAGIDGFFQYDDWGLQDRLMISPAIWREIWKPRYSRIYSAAHNAGMITFLHSCGNIVEILDDLIEIGLDVINMDQQMNMGIDLLGSRFGGRITFYSPVDIQVVMPHGDVNEIKDYCNRMVKSLGRPEGGFIAKLYPDPEGAGHTPEAVDAMCEEFLRIRGEYRKFWQVR